MRVTDCPLCGYPRVGSVCPCEMMTKSERVVWQETGQLPKHLSGKTIAQALAEYNEEAWWYEQL